MEDAGFGERLKLELKTAGVTRFGMKKFAIRYLPSVIHKNEHIGGIVYGRYGEKTGSLTLNEGVLVATNRRIVFIDHKPGYTNTDELTYDVISGVRLNTALFSAVTLHTRLGDYELRFVNPKCAANFVRFVEQRRLEKNNTYNLDKD